MARAASRSARFREDWKFLKPRRLRLRIAYNLANANPARFRASGSGLDEQNGTGIVQVKRVGWRVDVSLWASWHDKRFRALRFFFS
jgi:hypothetical protein